MGSDRIWDMSLLHKLREHKKTGIAALLAIPTLSSAEVAYHHFFNGSTAGIAYAQETKYEAKPVLDGLKSYETNTFIDGGLTVKEEKFNTPDGGRVWRYSHNGKEFAYFIDHDRIKPFDKILLKENEKDMQLRSFPSGYKISVPEWAIK